MTSCSLCSLYKHVISSIAPHSCVALQAGCAGSWSLPMLITDTVLARATDCQLASCKRFIGRKASMFCLKRCDEQVQLIQSTLSEGVEMHVSTRVLLPPIILTVANDLFAKVVIVHDEKVWMGVLPVRLSLNLRHQAPGCKQQSNVQAMHSSPTSTMIQ